MSDREDRESVGAIQPIVGYCPAWVSTGKYHTGLVVGYGGAVWLSTGQSTNQEPAVGSAYWKKLADHGESPETPTTPGEGEEARSLGSPTSAIYLYTSSSNATSEWEINLVGGGGFAFPEYPVIQFWDLGAKAKVSESTLKVLSITCEPLEPIIKPVTILFETHAVKPLKKGETLLIRVAG